jgi:hypothetical protein
LVVTVPLGALAAIVCLGYFPAPLHDRSGSRAEQDLMIGFGFARIGRMLRIRCSRFAATAAGLAARAMSVLHNACRPSGVAGGFIADLTRSRAESNAPAFAATSAACSSCSPGSFRRGAMPCFCSNRRPCFDGTARDSVSSGVEYAGRAVHANRVSLPMSSPSSGGWRPRTGCGEPSAFAENS